jgi:hypothetical protein
MGAKVATRYIARARALIMRATLQSGKMTREAVARATTKHWKGLGLTHETK